MYFAERHPEKPRGLMAGFQRALEKAGLVGEKDYSYARYNEDRTRAIILWVDRDCGVSRACQYSLTDNYARRVMEVCRSGIPGDFHYTIMIESVTSDESTTISHWGYYDQDGILHLTGESAVLLGTSPDTCRDDLLGKGHFNTGNLLPVIDFEETVRLFMINAANPNPSFDTPQLVPVKPQLNECHLALNTK